MYLYEIRNTINNKCYIGQTLSENPITRFRIHRAKLRRNSHVNIHLQRAWNKYGENAFQFDVVERCRTRNQLNRRETKLIAERGDYNIAAGGDNTTSVTDEIQQLISKRKRPQGYSPIIDPRGRKHKIKPSLDAFARKHKLTAAALRLVMYGKLYYHKGWHLETTTKSQLQLRSEGNREDEYPPVIGPNGSEYQIINQRQFVIEHGLNRRHFKDMLQGKLQQHRGWHIKGTTIVDSNILRSKTLRNGKSHPQLKSPTGIVYAPDNLNEFCRQYGLSDRTLYHVFSGKFSQHKGWTLA